MTKLKVTSDQVRVMPKPGENVEGAVHNAVNFAKKYDCNVRFETNGVSRVITPETDPDKFYNNYFTD